MDWSIRPSARERAIGRNVRECLSLWEQAIAKEGDAFLVRMRVPDAVLLMEDGPYGTWFFGMHRPNGRVTPWPRARELLDVHPFRW